MSRIFIKITLILALICLFTAAEQYKKIIHNTDPKAKCLDGSSPAVYLHQGSQKTKFLIYFVGGGYCEGSSLSNVLESCYQRSKTVLGSSKYLNDTVEGEGYLSTDPSKNLFAQWTKVIINYCDGSLHQGSATSAYKFKDAQLYFRGADNTRSHLKWLNNTYQLYNADSVVLTGSSAGGVATFLWQNVVRAMLVNPRNFASIIDSGLFMNVVSPNSGEYKLDIHMQTLYKLSNANEQTPIVRCHNKFQASEEYKCLFLQNSWTSLDGRTLLINSQYDSWAIKNVIQIDCLTDGQNGKTLSKCSSSEISNIEVYRKKFDSFIDFFKQLTQNSVWTISCSNHVYTVYNNFYDSPAQKVPESTGETVRSAVQKFVNGERVSSMDAKAWPSNSACAN